MTPIHPRSKLRGILGRCGIKKFCASAVKNMARIEEFGMHEDGLPGPEEISDEEKRTKERKSAYRGDFLSAENIPHWFTDIATEREEEDEKEKDRKEKLIEDFGRLPVSIQREITKQLKTEKELNPYNMDVFKRAQFLIGENFKFLRREERMKRMKRTKK